MLNSTIDKMADEGNSLEQDFRESDVYKQIKWVPLFKLICGLNDNTFSLCNLVEYFSWYLKSDVFFCNLYVFSCRAIDLNTLYK